MKVKHFATGPRRFKRPGEFLDTRGQSTLSVAICDRCRKKVFYSDLQPDPNFPGLRVCPADRDMFDPYRLAARKTEVITLQYARPDERLDDPPAALLEENDVVISLENDPSMPLSGNLGVLTFRGG